MSKMSTYDNHQTPTENTNNMHTCLYMEWKMMPHEISIIWYVFWPKIEIQYFTKIFN
jgi:hypothetical protein